MGWTRTRGIGAGDRDRDGDRDRVRDRDRIHLVALKQPDSGPRTPDTGPRTPDRVGHGHRHGHRHGHGHGLDGTCAGCIVGPFFRGFATEAIPRAARPRAPIAPAVSETRGRPSPCRH